MACITNMRALPTEVVLKPLPGLPVIRDLIADMTQFFNQHHSIKPYLINDARPPERERLQSPEQRDSLNGLYECILCACCTSACPSHWWNTDKYVARRACCRPIAFWGTAATRQRASGWTTWKTLAASSAAAAI